MSEIVYTKRLASGYWHVHFGPYKFAQWKTGELCTPKDVFGGGGYEELLADEANRVVGLKESKCATL